MAFPHPLQDRYFEELKTYLSGKFSTLETGITSLGLGIPDLTLGTIPKKGASTLVDSLLIENGIRIGLGGTPRITKGFDIFGTNPKATTAAVENLFQVASNDAADPLRLTGGIRTHATDTSRYAFWQVFDGASQRHLILQPNGGNTGIGSGLSPQGKLEVSGSAQGAVPAAGVASTLFQVTAGGLYGTMFGALGDGRSFIQAQRFDGTATVYSLLIQPNGGNLLFGSTTSGASANKVMAVGNGTIPGTIADGFQLVSADIVAGNAAPHFVTEAGPVIRLYQQAGIVDADGTLADATTKLNTVIQVLENLRFLAVA